MPGPRSKRNTNPRRMNGTSNKLHKRYRSQKSLMKSSTLTNRWRNKKKMMMLWSGKCHSSQITSIRLASSSSQWSCSNLSPAKDGDMFLMSRTYSWQKSHIMLSAPRFIWSVELEIRNPSKPSMICTWFLSVLMEFKSNKLLQWLTQELHLDASTAQEMLRRSLLLEDILTASLPQNARDILWEIIFGKLYQIFKRPRPLAPSA